MEARQALLGGSDVSGHTELGRDPLCVGYRFGAGNSDRPMAAEVAVIPARDECVEVEKGDL